jgi:hypothetical protein
LGTRVNPFFTLIIIVFAGDQYGKYFEPFPGTVDVGFGFADLDFHPLSGSGFTEIELYDPVVGGVIYGQRTGCRLAGRWGESAGIKMFLLMVGLVYNDAKKNSGFI